MDIKSKEERSRNMAAIKSKNTKPEVYFRKLLFNRGYRYRINEKSIIGHPDIFLRKYNTAIFVHGCFWHRHSNCKFAYTPKSRTLFWEDKFEKNKERDNRVKERLNQDKIKCIVIWECSLKKMKTDDERCELIMRQIDNFFINDNLYMEI